jgi:MinD-like ATPase involved in chromosome partitioning or flagellar assembly/predicted negative regulator of RcsB-dependent stress response
MKIISFYSYKGGSGRTQLLANLASYLCYYKNKKILMIDWDMEAPGLHNYFHDFNVKKVKKGLIEYFMDFEKWISEKAEVNYADYPTLDESYVCNIVPKDEKSNRGIIDFIAAGNYQKNYEQNITQHNWIDFLDENGKLLILKLKDDLEKKDYDFIFIDSRTGISNYMLICNVYIPSINVLVVAPTHQSLEGNKKVADIILDTKYVKNGHRSSLILPILSRIEKDTTANPQDWEDEFIKQYAGLLGSFLENQEIQDDFINNFYEIYLEDTTLYYDRGVANGERIFFNNPKEILYGSTDKKKEDIIDKKKAISYNSIDKKYENIANLLCETPQSDARASVLLRFAKWYKNKKDYDKALYVLNCIDKKDVYNDINVILETIQIYRLQGKEIMTILNKGLELTDKVLLQNIEQNSKHFLLEKKADLCAEKGDYQGAIEYINEALKISPNDANLKESLSRYKRLQRNETDNAKEVINITQIKGFKIGDKVLVDWDEDVYCYPALIMEIDTVKQNAYKIYFFNEGKNPKKGLDWYGATDLYKWDLEEGEKIFYRKRELSNEFIHSGKFHSLQGDIINVEEENGHLLSLEYKDIAVTR